jgi:glycerol-3-phosphate dehydrogenase
LSEDRFDVLVVGGGITGAGVALDAAARGMRTALVEAADFASGTSSRSSKLVHGGLRYLQNGEVGLVYESLAERQRLLENAPHLVRPLPFLVPILGRDGAASPTVVRAVSSALWAYDLAGGLRIGRRHRRVSAVEAARRLPACRPDRLAAGFLYWDAQADDARLTLEVLRTAVLDYGAVACNRARVVELVSAPGGAIRGARVVAEAPGQPGVTETLEVAARVVVNATGVWADRLAGPRADGPGAAPRLRPAKGVHLALRRDRVPCDAAVVVPVPGDRRSVFLIPFGDHVYLGTTDTDYDGDLEDPRCDAADVSYLLGALNALLTDPVSPADVTGTWAGLRPLLADDSAAPRRRRPAERTADLSRRHSVTVSEAGLVTVTGGKLTTYRRMAADAVDQACRLLGGHPRRSPTRRLSLRGAALLRHVGASGPPVPGLDRRTWSHLLGRYGADARVLAAMLARRPELEEPLVPGTPYLGVEAVYAVRHEMATTLEDVLARRTRALLFEREATARAAPAVARLVGPELGWDEAETGRQLAAFDQSVARSRVVEEEAEGARLGAVASP